MEGDYDNLVQRHTKFRDQIKPDPGKDDKKLF